MGTLGVAVDSDSDFDIMFCTPSKHASFRRVTLESSCADVGLLLVHPETQKQTVTAFTQKKKLFHSEKKTFRLPNR